MFGVIAIASLANQEAQWLNICHQFLETYTFTKHFKQIKKMRVPMVATIDVVNSTIEGI